MRSRSYDFTIAIIMSIVVLGVACAFNWWRYGDWSCAFKQCVLVDDIKSDLR